MAALAVRRHAGDGVAATGLAAARAPETARPAVKVGLPPVIDSQTRVLVLGSFPGEESLRQRQYYAHPRNQFWRLLGEVIVEPLPQLPYSLRLATLAHHRIGVWDVITRCERCGSLDGAIRNAVASDFAQLRTQAPRLVWVCFNGKTAGRAERSWREAGFATRVLPSSSPAYTIPFARKLAAWRAVGAVLKGVRRD